MIQASHPKMNFNEEPGKQKSTKVIKKKKRRRIVQCRYRKRKLSQEIKKKWKIQASMMSVLMKKSVILSHLLKPWKNMGLICQQKKLKVSNDNILERARKLIGKSQ